MCPDEMQRASGWTGLGPVMGHCPLCDAAAVFYNSEQPWPHAQHPRRTGGPQRLSPEIPGTPLPSPTSCVQSCPSCMYVVMEMWMWEVKGRLKGTFVNVTHNPVPEKGPPAQCLVLPSHSLGSLGGQDVRLSPVHLTIQTLLTQSLDPHGCRARTTSGLSSPERPGLPTSA